MDRSEVLSKVPAVTLAFWVIKILATTLGETGGDSITMTWLGETTNRATGYGYLLGTVLVLVPFIALVIAQIVAKNFQPILYWTTIVASTMLGTTVADFADRSLGIGYTGGSSILLLCVLLVLGLWYRSQGTIAVETVNRAQKCSIGRRSRFHARNGARGLVGGHIGVGLPWCGPRICGRFSGRRGALLRYQRVSCAAVLGGFHFDTTAWSDCGRFSRQTVQ